MSLHPCTAVDLGDLLRLRREREHWMLERGIDQWRPGSLPRSEVVEQLSQGQWYRDGGGRLAALRLLEADPDFWGQDDAAAVYVHSLMVGLAESGAGLGARMLTDAGELGVARGRPLLRLDCAPHLVPYYLDLGFVEVRTVQFAQFTSTLLERPAAGPVIPPTV